MNYKRIYDQLIERGKTRILEGYVERHHIIPRCMGGTNESSNLVDLTPEEHLVAHLLLVKIYPGNASLVYAANMMGNRVPNNKQYGWIKRKFSINEHTAKVGVSRTISSRIKQSDTVLRKFAAGYVHPCVGRHLSEEHKQKVSEGNKGKTIPTRSRSSLEGYQLRYGDQEGQRLYDEHRSKKDSASLSHYIRKYGEVEGTIRFNRRAERASIRRSTLNVGFTHTEESKRKISEAKVGKKIRRTPEHNAKIGAANKGRKLPTVTCIHCGLSSSQTNINRWHNDNCKHKP